MSGFGILVERDHGFGSGAKVLGFSLCGSGSAIADVGANSGLQDSRASDALMAVA